MAKCTFAYLHLHAYAASVFALLVTSQMEFLMLIKRDVVVHPFGYVPMKQRPK